MVYTRSRMKKLTKNRTQNNDTTEEINYTTVIVVLFFVYYTKRQNFLQKIVGTGCFRVDSLSNRKTIGLIRK